jgi:hypothetical protein
MASAVAVTTDRERSAFPAILGDLVPTWMTLLRKTRVLATTSMRSVGAPASTEEFVAQSISIANSAADQPLLDSKILVLWQLEGLAFAFFEAHDDGGVRVADLGLPPEAGPPVQCGVAMAEVLKQGFDADRLLDRLEAVSDPVFARFGIETIGLMLAVYERDLMGVATSLLGRVGVVRHTRLRRPALRSFLESVPQTCWPLIAHGYGRALYFKRFSLEGSLRIAQRQDVLPVDATARGVVAAYTLINSRDLGRVLQLRGSDSDVELKGGIEGGILNTLVLLEWTFPGCLGSIDGVTDRGSRLIDEATGRAEAARRQGQGPSLLACREETASVWSLPKPKTGN